MRIFAALSALFVSMLPLHAASVEPPAGAAVTWGAEPVEETAPGRGRIVLNGLWRFQPADAARMDAAALPDAWGWIRVPGVWADLREWPRWRMPGVVAAAPAWKAANYDAVFAAWHEREITIPAEWAGRAVVVELERVSTDATVFVDGRRAGDIRWPSGEADVTPLVTAGQKHRLSILVQATPQAGEVLTLMDFNDASASKAKLKSRGLTDDVRLLSRPRGARIDGLFIQTSVRERKLSAQVELAEWPAGALETMAAARVLERATGATVAEFPRQTLPVKDAVVSAAWDWIAPKLWDIGQPNLYTLEVTLQRPDGERVDTVRERFGFREFRVEGRNFYLNEKPLRLRPFYQHTDNTISGLAQAVDEQVAGVVEHGYNFWEMWPRNWNLRGEVQFNRLWAASADERGLAMSLPFAHPGGFMGVDMWHNRPIPEADFAAWEKVMRAEWKKYRNHPSVVMWIGYANMFSHGDDQNPRRLGQRPDLLANGDYGTRPRIGSGMRLVNTVKALDPTRPVTTHHGGPIGDFQTVNHYLNLMPLQEREEHPSEWAREGDVPFMSIEFGVPFSLTFTRGRNGYGPATTTEPLVTEHAASYLGPEAYALETPAYRENIAKLFKSEQVYGNVDNATTIHGNETFQRVAELFIRNSWRSWRMWGVTGGMIPWSGGYTWRGNPGDAPTTPFTPGMTGAWFPDYRPGGAYPGPAGTGELTRAGRALREVNGPTLAWIAGPAPRADDAGSFTIKDARFFAGAAVEKSVALANDERAPQPYDGEIVVTLAGAELKRHAFKGELAVGENRFEPFGFTVPAATAAGEGEITLRARIGGREHADRFAWRAYPRANAAGGAELAVWDPEGATTAMLAGLGHALKPANLAAADAVIPTGRPLVIGRKALAALSAEQSAILNTKLAAHVRGGGRVLVFAQAPEGLREAGFRLSRFVSRRFWPVATQAGHPVLAGLDAEDFRDWAGEGTLVPPLDAPMPSNEGAAFRAPVFGYRWGTRGSVSSAAIEKPHRSGWTPLLEGEFDLAYSPLMELRAGAGRVVWCQLDVEGRVEREPAARRVVENMIRHAAESGATAPRATGVARYLGGEDGAALLRATGVKFETVERVDQAAPLVVVGADARVTDEALRGYLAAGGRAVLLPVPAGTQRLGLTVGKGPVGAVDPAKVPEWEELRGVSASDLRLRVSLALPRATGAETAEVAAGGLAARVRAGAGSALWIQTDPRLLPADTKTYYRYSQWRWTRALAQVLANAGAEFAQDDALFGGESRDVFAPIGLAGEWRAQVERAEPEGTPDAGNEGRGLDWPAAAFDDTGWRTLKVPGAFEQQGESWARLDGAVWYRRTFTLPAAWEGKDLWLNLGVIDDEDTTYVNGRQVGRTEGENAWSRERRYRVPGWLLRPGVNTLAVRVYDLRGEGGFMTVRAEKINIEPVERPLPETRYAPGFRVDHELGDDPARYYRW